MMSALHRVLVEFDRGLGAEAATPAWQILDRPMPMPDQDGFDLGEPGHDPVGEAVSAALAEAEAEYAARIEAAEAKFADDLAEARARWVADEGQALAEGLCRAAAEAEDRLADAVAAVLEPFVAEAVRQAAVAELRGALADLLAGGAGGRIAISGPEDLLASLRASLVRAGIDEAGIDVAPSDAAEVAITADGSAVRTRLAEWTQAFRRRLEGEA